MVLVRNAGVVLMAPFLPMFFARLEMVETRDGVVGWKDAAAAARAPHLLQWLVDGGGSAPEQEMALNKVLCGLSVATPLDATIDLTEQERALGDALLHAMLAHWSALAGSSVEALRETFLQRDGRLEAESDRWKLKVQRKTVDVLVDQVPWSFSMVRLPWMGLPLDVSW